MQTQSSFSASQVFTFCGHIADDDVLNLKSGYVVAADPQAAIASMQEYGFSITAISSLSEVRETIGILELIARRDSDVDPSEYIDLASDEINLPICDQSVFTFVGYYGSDLHEPKVGFAIATDFILLCDYLQRHQFTVHSVTSLEDLRGAERELEAIATGNPNVDDCNYLNLILSS